MDKSSGGCSDLGNNINSKNVTLESPYLTSIRSSSISYERAFMGSIIDL